MSGTEDWGGGRKGVGMGLGCDAVGRGQSWGFWGVSGTEDWDEGCKGAGLGYDGVGRGQLGVSGGGWGQRLARSGVGWGSGWG